MISIKLYFLVGFILHAHGEHILIPDVPYGSHPEQIMDIYLPSSENSVVSKVVVLVHGGAWFSGEKADMLEFVPFLERDFPDYCIANMDYQLGTHESPGFPKQVDDLDLALTYLRGTFTNNVTFALFGTSAGAHLSMLYSYSRNVTDVKIIVSHVGPPDLTDPSYVGNPLYNGLFYNLVGPCLYAECPDLYNATSPLVYVNERSAKTIGFYGDFDLQVPSTQMPLLREKLGSFGVTNKFKVYQGGHGWNWSDADKEDLRVEITQFFNENW
ncbi:uncharacterized protein LOC110855666 isoform X2 [Folsomia candida]|uniref:Putative isoprenylcysteine alpha-carbonyl methylesterase ICMEL2 n=1 Tax=Folsomia candida TaxID=158441 RepID=A0A226DRX6_FOLCA|nr:uncharacterized protein LOC110855666 isoform X2 [Folsomia candida]OXA47451.1 putative isoprenylcysteine alpha-carbonyl methylesterase ICMEL2 [Folsomia candida]